MTKNSNNSNIESYEDIPDEDILRYEKFGPRSHFYVYQTSVGKNDTTPQERQIVADGVVNDEKWNTETTASFDRAYPTQRFWVKPDNWVEFTQGNISDGDIWYIPETHSWVKTVEYEDWKCSYHEVENVGELEVKIDSRVQEPINENSTESKYVVTDSPPEGIWTPQLLKNQINTDDIQVTVKDTVDMDYIIRALNETPLPPAKILAWYYVQIRGLSQQDYCDNVARISKSSASEHITKAKEALPGYGLPN